MKLPEIIGLAGTNGAGKDDLADVRLERLGARKVSLSDILRTEAVKRGLDPSDRVNLGAISTEWGKAFGAGALSLMTLKEFWETRTDEESGISIVSVRRPAEAVTIQENNGLVFWIDAEPELRYERVLKRNRDHPGAIGTFDKFFAQENTEMYPSSDNPAALNMAGVRDIANIHITNEFPSAAAYKAHLIDEYEL